MQDTEELVAITARRVTTLRRVHAPRAPAERPHYSVMSIPAQTQRETTAEHVWYPTNYIDMHYYTHMMHVPGTSFFILINFA